MKAQEGFAMNTLSMKKLAFGIVCAFAASAGLFAGAPTVTVSGTVTDGSGHGWPLYARVEFTSPSTDPVVAYSDPVTGQYAANVADATTHTVVVTAVAPGYAAGGGTVVTAGAPIDADWTLARRGPLHRRRVRRRHLRASGPLRELRRRRPSARLERADRVRRELDGHGGRGSLRALRRKSHRRIGPVRDRQQQLRLLLRRHVPGDAGRRPLGQRQRRDSLGERLHRQRQRRPRRSGRHHRRRRDVDQRLEGSRRGIARARASRPPT